MTGLVSPGRLARAPVASVTMSSNGVARPVLVAVAWPYASGSRHLGHLAGAYLPADVFARFQRRVGNRVLMVSGSDVHGTPITVRADADGVTPNDIVDRYHAEFVDNWERLGISWDGYPRHLPAPSREGPHRQANVRPVLRRGSRAVPARPLHRGHLPALRLHRGTRRPVRELRENPRPGGADQPTVQDHRQRTRLARPSTSSSACRTSRSRWGPGWILAKAGGPTS